MVCTTETEIVRCPTCPPSHGCWSWPDSHNLLRMQTLALSNLATLTFCTLVCMSLRGFHNSHHTHTWIYQLAYSSLVTGNGLDRGLAQGPRAKRLKHRYRDWSQQFSCLHAARTRARSPWLLRVKQPGRGYRKLSSMGDKCLG